MNHLMIIAIAFASIIAQGCVVEDTPDAPSNDLPEVDARQSRSGPRPMSQKEVRSSTPSVDRPRIEDDDLLGEVELPIGEGARGLGGRR